MYNYPMEQAGESQTTEPVVAILDAGAQYGKVIDRRIRNLAVRSDLLPLDTAYEELVDYDAFVISGGPESVYADDAPHPQESVWQSGKPILGICYGMQLINQAYGGQVGRKLTREDGQVMIDIATTDSPLFAGLNKTENVLMSHGDSLSEVAPGFEVTARSGEIVAAIADEKRRVYGLQFHPEVDLTEHGNQIFKNFLFEVAGLKASYTMEDRRSEAVRYIREQAGEREVLLFASGGVDSTVCAALVAEALPAEQVRVVHVDTGFMRLRESEAVKEALGKAGVDLQVVDAREQFANATTDIDGRQSPPLQEVTDPEVKRRIIGDTFMKVMERVIDDLRLDPQNTVLAQGTLRPDLIESASELASSKAAVIKTHHNDTPLVRELRQAGRVIEPLQELHKDEVRQLGEQLGLPAELVWRQPFPGPGLAIRLLCAREPYMTDEFDEISQTLRDFEDADTAAHLLPVRTVGVQGDGRSYSYLAALSGKPDWPKLFAKAREIPKQLHAVNRVVYTFGNKLETQPSTITPTLLNPDTVDQLRQADAHVNEVLRQHGLLERLSQVPVVSFPIDFGEPGKRSIGLRPFITNDFMTGRPAIPGEDLLEAALTEMVERVLSVKGVTRVVYDLTAKPPGTTEWE